MAGKIDPLQAKNQISQDPGRATKIKVQDWLRTEPTDDKWSWNQINPLKKGLRRLALSRTEQTWRYLVQLGPKNLRTVSKIWVRKDAKFRFKTKTNGYWISFELKSTWAWRGSNKWKNSQGKL